MEELDPGLDQRPYVTFGRKEGQEEFPPSLLAGIGSFLRAPVVPPVTEALRKAGARAAVLGLPWEGTNTCRPGASYGPRAIRQATEHYVSYHGEFRVDLFQALGLVDCGDVSVVPGNAQRTFQRAQACVEAILDAGAFPVVLGGDDSCPIPVAWAVSRWLGDRRLGYIQMDSHLDTAEAVAGESLNHACPVARIAELPNVDPGNIAIVGVNGPLNPPAELEYARRHGIGVYSIWDFDELGVDGVAERVLERVWQGTDAVLLHTDLDCMDQGFVPGVTTPETGGLTPREVMRLVRAFVRQGIAAYVIVECSPVYDLANASARVAARLALDALGVRANPDGPGRITTIP